MSNVDVKKLIEAITANVMQKTAFQDTVYKDEPIIRTASQMNNYLPDEIKEMKKLASERLIRHDTNEYTFYRQAKLMENYEDDYSYRGEFFSYYPTYTSMSDIHLRGYFSWRTKVRQGDIQKTSLSFAFLYMYELIHLIGSEFPEEGFYKFRDFCNAYCKLDPKILRYSKTWLTDFVIYYDLDKSLIEEYIDSEFDTRLSVLDDYGSHSEEELFEAICAVSSYNIGNSKLFQKYPEDIKTVVCEVFRQLSVYNLKNRKKSLCEKLFGSKVEISYHMFESAVFYDHKKHTDFTYEINDSYKYSCRDGKWYCEKYYCNRSKNKWLGDVIKSIDSIMRQKLDFGHPIVCPCDTKWVISIINKAIDDIMEQKKKNAAPVIEIDVSKLEGIRKAADITRDKLMTEEERGSIPEANTPAEENYDFEEINLFDEDYNFFLESSEEEYAETVEALRTSEVMKIPVQEASAAENDTSLDENEQSFMRSLLYGEVFNSKIMPSLLADSINEKLYDTFGDIVIDFSGDTPEIIEDYIEELKGMIPE
ncbi:MAG: TerB N-terminal domain-containing protein [Oscillospiraceae bacterium]|nr:TerB N-terminal domain-containing protein [Oscillospiraceae bacterium]